MNTFDYNPTTDLQKVFQSPESLQQLPELLNHIHQHKVALTKSIHNDITTYNQLHSRIGTNDIIKLIDTIHETQQKSTTVQTSISSITTEISKLDNLKKNLTLSMNIFKRLQILNYSINELNQLLKIEYDYGDIYNHLKNIKELLEFFRPYKSIDQINKLTLIMTKIEVKLIDNIFIDFEEILVYHKPMKQLSYACQILELIDPKQPDKLLNWFYNLQLKDLKQIFNNFDEAGSLENLKRRFLYFNSIFDKVCKEYGSIFPENWNITLELTKIFCEITKEDILSKLQSGINSEILLNCLNTTLEFENTYNTALHTTYFTKVISKVFEPYLSVWISEQDKLLNLKMVEFYSVTKIPSEFQDCTNFNDFLDILKVNSIPNISNSSIELFKMYQKTLISILKISNGKILLDLANLFNKYLSEYHNRILAPIINSDLDSSSESDQLEVIKYLTMILNTGDYIINNLDDLSTKINNVIAVEYRDKFSFENLKSVYLATISGSINKLLGLIQVNLKFSWRQFENNNWEINESSKTLSNYMVDFKECLTKYNRIILPLIIRESYVKNFCNKLIELIVRDFANNLKVIKPLSILSIEQILNDLADLKQLISVLPNYSNVNYELSDSATESKYYQTFVNTQLGKLETLLNLLLTPTLPVDNLVENYFTVIHDKSQRNFRKFLTLKNLTVVEQRKYIEVFNSNLSDELTDESPILAMVEDQPQQQQQIQSPIEDTKPKLKINNLEKNLRELAITGENNITKFNENFKNFGKLFRKDNNE